MKRSNTVVCGRNIAQKDELEWVPLETQNPFLYVSKTTRIWAFIPFLYSCWFLFICLLIMFVFNEGDYEKNDILRLLGIFCIAVVWLFLVYKSSNEKQQMIKRIATDIEKPTSSFDGIYLIKSRNHVGLYDGKTAEILLKTKYDFIEKDEYGLYFVIKGEKCGLYDSEGGNFVLNCSYDEIMEYDTDSAIVLQDGIKKEVKLIRNK